MTYTKTETDPDDKGEVKFDTTLATTVKTVLYPSLGLASSGTWAVDGNGVYYIEDTTGVTATNGTGLKAQSVAISNLTSNGVVNNTAITLTFNQPVKTSTIGTALSSQTTDTDYAYTIDTAGKLTLTKGGTTANLGTISGFTAATAQTGTAALTKSANGNSLVITITGATAGPAKVDGKIKYVPSASLTDELNNKIDASVSVETAGNYIAPANVGNADVTGVVDTSNHYLAANDTIKVKFTEAINITNLGQIKAGSENDYVFTIEKDTTDTTGKTIIIKCTAVGQTANQTSVVIPATMIVDNDGQNPATNLIIALNGGAIS